VKKKILILSANPKNTDKLRLDEEVREIRAALKRSKGRDQFEVITESAVRVEDLLPTLLDHEPDVVHFSGHGAGTQGLALENNSGKVQLVSTAALARLFKAFRTKVQCVFLNACYSEAQAETIHQHIDYVVGMNKAIGDRAAIEFAVGFYTVIFSGRAYEEAFELGCTSIDLEGIPESETPTFRAKPRSLVPSENESIQVEATSSNLVVEEELSAELGVKVARVFISYRSQEPDWKLAQQFHDALEAAGHDAFMAGESIRLGENWPQRIDAELETCDYFLLLLSPQSALSEMVTEEVRRAKQLRNSRPERRPVILPVRVNFPLSSPLNYDLRGYLQQIQQREWHSDTDTPVILSEICRLIAEGTGDDIISIAPSPPLIESLDRPPAPVAEPELPEGQVDLASAFYVERQPIESRCYETIVKPGALIRIKAPRQMGKTSLMARTIYHASKQGCKSVALSFQLADEVVFADLDQFLQWFCASITSELELPDRLSDFWQARIGSKMSSTNYFERYLLRELTEPLVLGLDEVDLVFQHPKIASDFFGLLRAWHEKGKSSDNWKKLRLVVVHSTEVYIPLNMHQSPFNVGLPVELPEFTAEQVLDLAHRHGLPWENNEVEQLQAMVGGHPYLVREALYHITHQDITLPQLLQTASTEAGLYGDHLRRHWWNLEQHPKLAEALKRVVTSDNPIRLEPAQAFQLDSMGLVSLYGNDVTPRCDLYRQYFRDRSQGRSRGKRLTLYDNTL